MAIHAGYIEADDWLNLLFRVGLAIVIGGLIGFERQWIGGGYSHRSILAHAVVLSPLPAIISFSLPSLL